MQTLQAGEVCRMTCCLQFNDRAQATGAEPRSTANKAKKRAVIPRKRKVPVINDDSASDQEYEIPTRKPEDQEPAVDQTTRELIPREIVPELPQLPEIGVDAAAVQETQGYIHLKQVLSNILVALNSSGDGRK